MHSLRHSVLSLSLASLVVAAFLVPREAQAQEGGFSTSTSSATLELGPATSMGHFDDAPREHHFSTFRFELHFDFNWYGGIGGGGRIEFSIAEPLIGGVDNDLALSFGAELFYFYEPGYVGLGVYTIIALQWNFYVSRLISLFPELGVAFLFGPSRDRYWGTFIAPYLGLGMRVHFTDRNALLLRVSWPAGLQVGITF